MDFNSFKDLFKNAYNTSVNNPVFYFVKEKYDHLNVFYRKTIQVLSLLVLICILLYYPASRLYSSWKYIKNFNTKTQLIRELVNLSSAKQTSISGAYTFNKDPLQFIEQKIPTLFIPKNQVTKITNLQDSKESKNLPISATVKKVKLEMKDLNLKEVIQYGYQLEQLSDNIKLMNLSLKESKEKENYFNVSYILSFFNSTQNQNTLPNKRKKKNKLFKSKDEKIFDELKSYKTSQKAIEFIQEKESQKKQNLPLLDLKKEGFTDGNSHFENRPTKVKKRDLLPTPPAPENKKSNPALLNNIPSIPDTAPLPPALDTAPPSFSTGSNQPPQMDKTTEEK